MGFYTTIWVEAENEEFAEKQAVDIVRNQEDLRSSIRNAGDDPPMIYLEEIEVLESTADFRTNQGRTFFADPIKKWWQFWR